MADPFDFSQIDLSNPLGGTAPQGSIRSLFGSPTIASQAAGSTAAFAQRVLARMQERREPFENIILQELATPEGQAAASQPGFFDAMEALKDAIRKPQDEFMTVPAGSSVASKTTGKIGAQAPSAPTATEKLVQAIIALPEGSEERKLLMRGLAGTDGRPSVKDYLTLVAAGATLDPEFRPKGVTTPLTQAAAERALTLGSASGPRAPNGVDMFAAAMGIDVPGSPLNGVDKMEAQSMMLLREELAKQSGQSDPFLQMLLGAGQSQGAGGAGALGALGGALGGDDSGGLAALFEKINKGERAQAPGVQAPAGEVPIFGAGPKVGGEGGQAPGPRAGGAELRPDQLKAIEAMKPENFAELSAETLKQIVLAVIAKTLTLSEEQKAALIAANGARLGAAQ